MTTTQSTRRRITLFGLLFGVIILLGLLNLGVIAARPLFKPGAPATGELLYATGFDIPADPDWTPAQGQVAAEVKDGVLLLTADSNKRDNVYSPLAFTFSDFDLRATTKQTAGDDPYSEYGILFRVQNKDNYYLFRMRSDGAYHVTRSINGVQEDLSAAIDPERVLVPLSVGLNRVNDLRIVAKGDRFQFYVNGKQLTLCPKGNDKRSTWNGDQCASNNKQTAQELVDGTFRDGRIAFGIYENSDKVVVEFDNLVMTGPQ